MIGFLQRLLYGSEPKLSEAKPRDAAAIAALHAASFHRGWSEEEIDRLLLDRQVIAHRAMVGSRFVGFIMSQIAADQAEILSVAVVRSQRGRGVAGKLLNLHLRRLAALGVRAVFLEVDVDNAAARQLYRRAAFHEAGRREGYYSDASTRRAAALVLRRDLA
jgi:ribosomal-protein-alanine N-acetyltransferase